jgi:mRNA interferase MazF
LPAKYHWKRIGFAQRRTRHGTISESNSRPNRLFTVDRLIILYKAGSLKKGKTEKVVEALVEILRK